MNRAATYGASPWPDEQAAPFTAGSFCSKAGLIVMVIYAACCGMFFDRTINDVNQYTQIASPTAQIAPTYDADGNTLLGSTPVPGVSGGVSPTVSYSYDKENLLKTATVGNTKEESLYDGLSRRVETRTYNREPSTGIVTLTHTAPFVYDGWLQAQELDSVGSPMALKQFAALPAARGGGMTTVRSYTNAAGREGISSSGAMRADSWVTLPSEIPSRAGHLQIEKILEIQSGRGSHYLDFQVPTSNLRVPANGTTTSGGALQFQLNNPVFINPNTFRRPPGRPGG